MHGGAKHRVSGDRGPPHTEYGKEGDEDEVELALLHEERAEDDAARDQRHHGSPPPALAEDEGDDILETVHQIVPETDDVHMTSLTFRALLLGLLFTVLGAAMSQLFFYKSNAPVFSTYFVILVTLPLARWMAKVLPDWEVPLGPLSFRLNPGPFSIKEHLLIAVIASSGATSAYASDIINVQELFFHQHMSPLAGITLLITTQVLGFGFAGMVYDLLVRPPSMVYPSALVTVSLFNTLHGAESSLTRSRIRFFAVVFLAVLVYQFLPTALFPTLSSIALLCLAYRSRITKVLGSGYRGFGIANVSLDWNVLGAGGPLFQPWWAALNFYAGLMAMMYVVMPILWFSNFWNAQAFPEALSSALYNVKFLPFDIDSVLHPDNTLDEEAWAAKRPMLLTPFFALTYGISFAVLTSTITYVALWHGKDIVRALRNPVHTDVHNTMMRAYPMVPRSWYIVTLVLSLGAAIVLTMTTPLQFPVWALLLSVCMSLFFLIPVGILKAVSDVSIGLNVITEFVAGYLIPGKPIGNVCWKCYGFMSCAQAIDMISDLKLAHYMKISPRHMFLAQLIGTVTGCVVNFGVIQVVLAPGNGYRAFIDGSKPDPSGQWDGRQVHIFRSAAIIWGAVGPQRFFVGEYRSLYWGFLLGLLAPLLPWALHKYRERRLQRTLRQSVYSRTVVPIVLCGAVAPPGIPTNVRAPRRLSRLLTRQIILGGFLCSFLSQKWARERYPIWFQKYKYVTVRLDPADCSYVLSAALDAGTCAPSGTPLTRRDLCECACGIPALDQRAPLVAPAPVAGGQRRRGALFTIVRGQI